MLGRILAGALAAFALAPPVPGQLIVSEVKIDRDQGGLDMPIPARTSFASGLTNLGDVDGDGESDLAVGVPGWDDRRDPNNVLESAGEIAILLMQPDRTVRDTIVIRAGENGFVGPLAAGSLFGIKLAGLGDLDGDGVPDLAVGAPGSLDVAGSLWILFLNPDGTVKAEQRINGADFEVGGQASFGRGIAVLGDEDDDGRLDLMVGGWGDIYRVSVNSDGTADSVAPVTSGSSNFGYSIVSIGDLDENGIDDVIVGTPHADEIHIIYRQDFTTELSRVTISSDLNNAYGGVVRNDNDFGRGLATIPDLNGDGIRELFVGAPSDEGVRGVVWLVMLAPDGSIVDFRRIARDNGTIAEAAPSGMGWSFAPLGDLDGNGVPDIAVGINTLLFRGGRGAIWQFFLGCGSDCNGDGLGDDCVGYQDCNGNFAPDTCDTTVGSSIDCNGDFVPDECQVLGPVDLGGAVRFQNPSSASAPSRPILQIKHGRDMCLEVLVRVDESGRTGRVLQKGSELIRNYGLFLDQGRVEFMYAAPDGTPYTFSTIEPVVPADEWAHISLSHTFGLGNTKLYVNGEGVAGTWDRPPLAPPASELATGLSFGGSGFEGVLDEIRIWGQLRTQASVQLYMDRPVDPDHPDLLAYWRFDEGRGRYVEDLAHAARLTLDRTTWTSHYQCPPCPGDINGDGQIDLTELAIVLGEFGATGDDLQGDLTGDGTVDLSDIALLLSVYGSGCW